MKDDPFMSEEVVRIQEKNDFTEYLVLFDVSRFFAIMFGISCNPSPTATFRGNNLPAQ